jgi:hypothetical protein
VGGQSKRNKALTSQGFGVEKEWEAGWGNPAPHGWGCEGSAGLGAPAYHNPSIKFIDIFGYDLEFPESG